MLILLPGRAWYLQKLEKNSLMQDRNDNRPVENDSTNPHGQSESRQEQSDPQLTELKGFVDPKEDLEPTLTDGTKAPEKASEERKQDPKTR